MDPSWYTSPEARYRIVRHAGEYAGAFTGFYYVVERKGWIFWNNLFDEGHFRTYELAVENLQAHIKGELQQEGVVATFNDQGELLDKES